MRQQGKCTTARFFRERRVSTFAATFRELVIPDLQRMIAARGLFVALGLSGWSDAYG